jgi:hypothetical protein
LDAPFSRAVHKDAADDLRRRPEEMRTVVEFYSVLFGQLKIDLVHESGGRQGVWLSAKMTRGQPAQLVLDDRQQCLQRPAVAVAPLFQQHRDAWFWITH